MAHDEPLTQRCPRSAARWLICCAFLISTVQAVGTPTAHALVDPSSHAAWWRTPYSYAAMGQDLRDVLHEFSDNLGIPVTVSDQVNGTVTERWTGTSAREFLDRLASAYGLDWYFDGTTLFISNSAETTSAIVPVHGQGTPELASALMRAGFADDRYPLRDGPAPGTVLVSGPPRYVQLVEQSAQAISKKAPAEERPVQHGRSLIIMRGSASSRMTLP